MFEVHAFEAKNRVFEFDSEFEFVRCSKNDVRVRSIFDKTVFDPSLVKNGYIWLVIPIFTFYYNGKGRNGYDFSFHVNSLQNTCEAKFPFRPLFCSRLIR